MASPQTPKLITPDDRVANEPADTLSFAVPILSAVPPASGAAKKKLTRMLSVQSSFDAHQRSHPITKRFSIDADPSSIISDNPIVDLSNNPLQRPTRSSLDGTTPTDTSGKVPAVARSPPLKKCDSFLEIPYEKAEIVDLIKLADDPNAAAHLTRDGHEVLVEHAAAPH